MGVAPVLVVHGGAGSLETDEDRGLYLAGVRAALDAGLAALEHGADEAVRAAVVHMESHTIMNAGRGAALDADGRVRLDAGFMQGDSRRYGGVTGVTNHANPVLLAERLCAEGDYGRLVAPPGADRLAALYDLPTCAAEDLVSERASAMWRRRSNSDRAPGKARYLDTVGAVALDARGRTAAAVSTGGMSLKRDGRVGDAPIVGSGFWADDRHGAAVSTGVGEAILRQGSARRCVDLIATGATPAEAATSALAELCDNPGDMRGAAGLIVVSRDGEVALNHTSAEMSGGWGRPDGEPVVNHLWPDTATGMGSDGGAAR